jgi:glycerate-2-kinase
MGEGWVGVNASAPAANDSASWCAARDALFVTGPTGTNVNDLRILLVGPSP